MMGVDSSLCQYGIWNITTPICGEPAVCFTEHPLLGDVPTCGYHAGWGNLETRSLDHDTSARLDSGSRGRGNRTA